MRRRLVVPDETKWPSKSEILLRATRLLHRSVDTTTLVTWPAQRRGVGGGVGFPGGGPGATGPGRGRGPGLGGGWGRGNVTSSGPSPSLPSPAAAEGPVAGLRGVGGGVGGPGRGPGAAGPGRGRGPGLGGGWGRGSVMRAGLPPMSTRISNVSSVLGPAWSPLAGFLCAARMELFILRLSMPLRVWVLGAPKTSLCIPIVNGVALRVSETKFELFCLV